MKATGAAGALAMGVGSGLVGSAAGNIAEFQDLSVSSDNRIVNESDETFVMRGLNIPDPKRLAKTVPVRGKRPKDIISLLTDNERGWHPRVIRVPAQPADIGEHPNGHAGPEYEEGELESPDAVRDDRRKMQPAQPVAFTQQQLDDYLKKYYDPVVEMCKQRGVYCIVDFHRHWHEQPPGKERPAAAENHLPYDSQYTNYWAYNDHELFGKEAPGSWGHVDSVTIEELGNGEYVPGLDSESDLEGTPYDSWQVNEDLLEEATMFWDTVAERYADEPHVIFEPYNEPTAPGIWGPVEGCGAIKQRPLWDTFVDDFAGPLIETCREHAPDKLIMMGVPGWCQSIQALHWRNFSDAGYDDIAVTWHNYAGHDVSQVNNWDNDTDYQSPDAVEAETGKELVDPFISPPDSVYTDECWGWEAYEAAGLQNAMDHHPIAVTEFGWIDDPSVSHWLRGSTTGQGTTFEYGEPFLETIEADDRISWVAWCADPRWLPAMFEVDWTIEEGELELPNDNWYNVDEDDIPRKCDEVPCEWQLMGNPNSGAYIKQMLADKAEDQVPFQIGDTTGSLGDITVDYSDFYPNGDWGSGETTPDPGEGPTWPEGATDPDDDGYYEDLNGNGETDYSDVVDYFNNMDSDGMQNNVEYYDYNGNGDIDYADLVELFNEI